MIGFERTEDYGLVRRIMTHPRLYRHMSDDASPPREDFWPPEHPAVWYVLARDEGEVLGLFAFVPQNGVSWEAHVAMLPRAWGGRARRAAAGITDWIWRNTPCRRIVASVPASNRLALRFAEAAGMRRFGVNERSLLRGGRLYDQILFGASKPEVNP